MFRATLPLFRSVPHSRKPLAVAILGASLALQVGILQPLLSTTGQARAESATRQYSIEPGPLGAVLSRFASESGVVLSFDAGLTSGKRSQGLSGRYSLEQGFAQLLAGSGLKVMRSDSGDYLLAPRGSDDVLEMDATSVTGQQLGATTEGTGSYTTGSSSTATKLNLSLRETPQSVSVITRQRMDDQNMQNLDDVLHNTTGITIIRNGAERSEYVARGQLVDNLQIDGVPTNISNSYSMDALSKPVTEIYDRIEVVRGATGLMEGAGNPAAAINLVRKRPTVEPQLQVTTSAGSWDNYKTVVDASSALNDQHTLRGRTVISYNNANSYLDTQQKENQLFYGILEADLGESTLGTLGYSFQKERNSGYDWSALPTQADGKFLPLSRKTSLTGDWNHLDKRNTTVFANLEHRFDNDWKIVGALNQTWAKSDFLGNFTMLVPGTQSSFRLQPRLFRYDDTQTSLDGYAQGPFQLLGRQHELVVGLNARKDDFDYHGGNDVGYSYVFDINDYASSFNPPRPTGLDVNKWKYNITQEQEGVYAASRFSLTDSTSLILGSRISWFKTETLTNVTRRIESEYSENGEVTPYAGIVQDLNNNLSAYASYTEIFKPQNNLDRNGSILDPMTGSNYELGLKGEFLDKTLNASLALFQTDQSGRAEYVDDEELCPAGCYRASEKVRNRGVDLDFNGALTPDWNLSVGYTYTQSKYVGGEQKGDDYTQSAPRHLFKLATDYRLPGDWSKTRVGGSFYAQSKMVQSEYGEDYKIEQDAYHLTSLHVIHELDRHFELQYNLDNVFNKKYYQTVGNTNYWNFQGEPRNFNLTLRAKF
ncbi:TonB-dependent siderophore receptor [Pseudomonas sp. YH-1]|uniref:TonB-dependent siderophore receptor n=1 Tax=Pseudomonas sp. YH-1 TaxID=3384787 RepID=UPI003F820267